MNNWISVNDRLPKLATPVIVATACGNVFEAARIRKNRKHYWTNAVWEYKPMEIKTGKVTHWMPLPEPPNWNWDNVFLTKEEAEKALKEREGNG